MTNRTGRFLKQLGLAAVAAAIAGAFIVSVAGAQSPPTPPSRFVGSVTVNGQPAAAGTTIEARIGNTTCGATTVFMSGGQARYTLDSPALDPAQFPACGTDGATVTFFVGGQQANETGSWANYQLNTVNLTVSAQQATPTSPPAATATPRPPVAGTGEAGGVDAPLIEVILVATAIGLAGTAFVARARRNEG